MARQEVVDRRKVKGASCGSGGLGQDPGAVERIEAPARAPSEPVVAPHDARAFDTMHGGSGVAPHDDDLEDAPETGDTVYVIYATREQLERAVIGGLFLIKASIDDRHLSSRERDLVTRTVDFVIKQCARADPFSR